MTHDPAPAAAPSPPRTLHTNPRTGPLRALDVGEVRITGGIWAHMQELNSAVILEHCESWMERIGWLRNFDRIAGRSQGAHTGIEFVDSEVYKLLEAMAWELARRPDPALERRYDAIVSRVAAAQDDDGYLHTAFGHQGQRARYSDMEWGHELYCHGHLLQAAVARLSTGRDDRIAGVARRLFGHLWLTFGPGGTDAVCGHPEIEVALVEFARATGDARAIELARMFVERRGRRTLRTTLYQGSDYFLDDVPVRDATALRGHAVRALYLAAGALDVAAETGDDELAAAVERQYRHAVARRTYLTGGAGSHHQNEEFGDDFELPSDRAYAETCAAIASVMTAQRLLLATGDAAFADQIERTLLNAVLVSPRHDGRAFYYANTLHQRRRGPAGEDPGLSERAESVARAPWFEVSCCPTNVARTLASVARHLVTADDRGIQIQQYAACEIDTRLDDGSRLAVRVETDYPNDGRVRVTVVDAPAHPVTISLRIPQWARGEATVDATAVAPHATTVGITDAFAPGASFDLELPLVPRYTTPHRRMDALRGQVAVERGPLVLALEDVDLPAGLDVEHIALDVSRAPELRADGVHVELHALEDVDAPWPYVPAVARPARRVDARLTAYKDWGNRGPSTMRVWLPADAATLPSTVSNRFDIFS